MDPTPPRTRVGLDAYTVTQRGLSPREILALAGEFQLDGVQFLEPSVIDPGLCRDALEAFAAEARGAGMYLEVGLPSPNPVRQSRVSGVPTTPTDHARSLIPHIEAVAALGCRHARAYVGDRHDRFRPDTTWAVQLESTSAVLRELEPVLRGQGVKIAIETHADLTNVELVRWLDVFSDEWFGVTIDTGNLLMRLEDPLAAVRALAPRVLATHLKDAILAFCDRGLRWQARPVGDGIVPIGPIVGLLREARPDLALSIELHPRTYDLPIYDPTWLAHFPDLTPQQLAEVVRYASRCERSFAAGEKPRPETVEAIPWLDRDLDWLARSRDYLRDLLNA